MFQREAEESKVRHPGSDRAWKSEEKTVRTLGLEVGKALRRGVPSGLRGGLTSGGVKGSIWGEGSRGERSP